MVAKTSPAKPTTLIPPDESIWQKYSPHYELPLASATSIFLHGVIIGVMAVGGIAYLFSFNLDAAKPPRMDVVMIEGGGTGFEGLGGEQGLPGAPDAGAKTEQITPLPNQPPTERTEQRVVSLLPKDMPPELNIPLIDDGQPAVNSELAIELAKIAKQADEEVRTAMDKATPAIKPMVKKSGSIGAKGPGGSGVNPKGSGGSGGGSGAGEVSEQAKFAGRWRFMPPADAKVESRRIAEIGFTVALPDPRGGFLVITDLNRRPVEVRKDNLAQYKDRVRWLSINRSALPAMARELGLPFVPAYTIMFLPKQQEEKMVMEEFRYARSHGRDVSKIQATWFDFRLRNGAYEPVVIRQE